MSEKNVETRDRWLTVAPPALIGWALCAYQIGGSQFRGDELCTWWAASLPKADFQLLVGHVDAVLSPYYLLMRAWIGVFGDSEAAMRAPSAIAMGLCAGLVAALGTRLVDRNIGLRAGLVFALIPVVSRYGQEARPYAFATLFATLSSLLALRLIERPESVGRMLAYAAALTALGMSHVVALLIVPAHAACMMHISREKPYVQVERRPFMSFAIAATVAIVCVLALVVAGMNQLPDQVGKEGNLSELVSGARKLVRGSTMGALVMGVLIVAVALRTAFSSRQPTMLRLWAVIPPIVLFSTYSVLHLWAMRYLMFTLPALVLLIAIAIERPNAGPRYRAWATPIAVLALGVLGWNMQAKARSSLARSSGDYRAVGEDLSRLATPGDAIAYGGTKVIPRIPRLAVAYQLRQGPSLDDVFATKSMRELGQFAVEECDDPRACLPPTVERIWLLTSEAPTKLWKGMPPARATHLQREFVVSEVHPHWQANLVLLIRKPKTASVK